MFGVAPPDWRLPALHENLVQICSLRRALDLIKLIRLFVLLLPQTVQIHGMGRRSSQLTQWACPHARVFRGGAETSATMFISFVASNATPYLGKAAPFLSSLHVNLSYTVIGPCGRQSALTREPYRSTVLATTL